MSGLRVGVVLAFAVALAGGAASGGRSEHGLGCETAGARLGRIAYLRGTELHLLDLATCRDRVLARDAEPPLRFSPDGRFLAFGAAEVVSASGGRVLHPLPGAAFSRHSFAWSPRSDLLATVTRGEGILLGGPGLRPRRVARDSFGARELAFDPEGSLAVARAQFPPGRPPDPRRASSYHQEIWRFRGPSLAPERLFAERGGIATPVLGPFSPDGRFLAFWRDLYDSASLAADGLALRVRGLGLPASGRRLAEHVLVYDDYLAWCGSRLVLAAGFDRYATHGKRLLVASPPAWRTRRLSRDPRRSFVSPACSPDGRLVAAAAGPNRYERLFGEEARSLWLLALDGSVRRALTTPPAATSDETPRFSADGRFLLFVRSGPTSKDAGALGRAYLLRLADGRLLGPLASLGPTGNYYGHYGWRDWLDWTAGAR